MNNNSVFSPGFFQSVVIALLIAGLGSMVFAVLALITTNYLALRCVVLIVTFLYIVYLLSASRARVGRIVTILAWLLMATLTWYLVSPLSVFVLTHILFVWLVRSFYHHTSLLSASVDLMLNAFGFLFAVWAVEQSESLFLALWCFFLSQALFVYIPHTWKSHNPTNEVSADKRFQRAYRSAQAALRRVSS